MNEFERLNEKFPVGSFVWLHGTELVEVVSTEQTLHWKAKEIYEHLGAVFTLGNGDTIWIAIRYKQDNGFHSGYRENSLELFWEGIS